MNNSFLRRNYSVLSIDLLKDIPVIPFQIAFDLKPIFTDYDKSRLNEYLEHDRKGKNDD